VIYSSPITVTNVSNVSPRFFRATIQ